MDIIGDHLSSLNIVGDVQENDAVEQPSTQRLTAAQDVSVASGRRRNSPLEALAEAVVYRYLTQHWANSKVLAAFEHDLSSTLDSSQGHDIPDLLDLLRSHLPSAAGGTRTLAHSPSFDFPGLPGPSLLSHHVSHTHSTLHPSNILMLRSISLPQRRFNTSPSDGSDPHFEVRFTQCLASSGADKRVLFFQPDEADVLESLEPVNRTEERGHTAPVLEIAQHPVETRELVTAGMDGKVILWDLLMLRDGPIQILTDHSRFVVRCGWSSDGRWLATGGYDKKIHIYERIAENSSNGVGANDMVLDDQEEGLTDDLDLRPLKTQLRLAHTISTRGNPEALTFISVSATQEHLVYTVRDDCFLHYLSLQTWQEESFNTNETSSDLHVSYSILSLVVHPTLPLLSLLTGSHASISSNSLVILMPFFSSDRALVIHTTVPSSPTYTPRQAWRQDGAGVWISSEEGRLRLFDLLGTGSGNGGEERSSVGAHGALSDVELSGMSVEEKAKRWRMGGANGCIKDVIVLPDGRIASCGFDRTVRIVEAVSE